MSELGMFHLGGVARWVGPLPLLFLLVIVPAASTVVGPASYNRVVTGMLVNLVLVVGLYSFMGITGVFSFGHMGFMAIGAYVAALLTVPSNIKATLLPNLPGLLAEAQVSAVMAILVAGVVAALVAAVLALPLMRLSGLMAGIATFAFLVIVHVVARNWKPITNGTTGISGVPSTTGPWTALGWSLVVVVAVYLFQESTLGLRLRGGREDEVVAQSVGISLPSTRRIALIVSGFIVGIGGALFAGFLGAFSPDAFFLDITFLTIAMLVIGGTKALSGAVIGVLAVTGLGELLRQIENGVDLFGVVINSPPGLRQVGLAIGMLVILLVRPRGITGGREWVYPAGLGSPLSGSPPWEGDTGSVVKTETQMGRGKPPLSRQGQFKPPLEETRE